MTRRNNVDRFDLELAERARSARAFDLLTERPAYEDVVDMRNGKELTIKCNLSEHSLQMAARQLGPSFLYNLYVHTIRLLQARNLVWKIVAHVKSNPFAPHVNIVECPALDEGEWVLEANEKRVGSSLL